MNVLVVAEESAGLQALRLVTDRGHRVAAVLTGARAGDGRGSTVAGLARRLDIPTLDPPLVRDPGFAAWIATERVDLLLNVHSLQIAHAEVVAAPRIGSFNLHPGPLPRYAGLNAPSWAIYEGERRHAVTVHWMTADVDAGAIAYEAWFEIAPADTGLRVATNCVRHGTPLLARLLDDASRGVANIPATPQASDGRRWFGPATPHDGGLPWELPAQRIIDLVRAADYSPFRSPWGWPRTTLDGQEVEITRVSATGEPAAARPGVVGDERGLGVLVAAVDEWVLVERIRCEGVACHPAAALTPGRPFDPDARRDGVDAT
jgi:methionyl-tRNA formyltransferase